MHNLTSEKLAIHFTSITNQSGPLQKHAIPRSEVAAVLIPQLVERSVAERIKKYKKPSSLVPGDIPKKLVNKLSSELAIPLTLIYNKCLLRTEWPKLWKNEVVVPIPKTQTPVTFNDIRPISMSPLWS